MSCARARDYASSRPTARSCTRKCVRWWGRWSRSATDAGEWMTSPLRSPRAIAPPARRSRRRKDSIWCGWTTDLVVEKNAPAGWRRGVQLVEDRVASLVAGAADRRVHLHLHAHTRIRIGALVDAVYDDVSARGGAFGAAV